MTKKILCLVLIVIGLILVCPAAMGADYTDYQKIFKYYKDISYASADPGTGSNITNKVQYVKYREK